MKLFIFQPKELEAQEIQDLQNRGWAKVGGSMLFHVDTPDTQKNAQEHCENLDSKLVEFWSEEEWNEVSLHFQSHRITLQYAASIQITHWAEAEMPSNSEKAFWIGLSDIETEGQFVWDSGREVFPGLFSKWGPGQPSNKPNKDCAAVIEKGGIYPQLTDKLCNNLRHHIVCQKRIFQYNLEVLKQSAVF